MTPAIIIFALLFLGFVLIPLTMGEGGEKGIGVLNLVIIGVLVPSISYFSMPAGSDPLGGYGTLLFWLSVIFLIEALCTIDNATSKITFTAALLLFVVSFGTWLLSWPIFTSSERSAWIGEIEKRDWSADIQPTSVDDMRLMGHDSALALARTQMGNSGDNLGSVFEINAEDMALCLVKDRFFYVAPLAFKSYSRWSSHRESPGFIMVDAHSPTAVPELKTGHKMRFIPSAYRSSNLHRHLYNNGYSDYVLMDFSLELDDDLKPYYVVTAAKNSVWGNCPVVKGVCVVDPETGHIDFYEANSPKMPAWIDLVTPGHVVRDQIAERGQYVHGWFNSWWTSSDLTKPDVQTLAVSSTGEVTWITPISADTSSDDAMMGVFYTSARTGKHVFYKTNGSTISEAMEVVNNQVSFKGQKAESPMLYNVFGEMSVVCSLINDKTHIFAGVAVVKTSNKQATIGTDVKSTMMAYHQTLSRDVSATVANPERQAVATGTVFRVATDPRPDGTTYSIILSENRQTIFTAQGIRFPFLPFTQAGDKVEIRYAPIESSYGVPVESFKNITVEDRAASAPPAVTSAP